MTDRLTIEELDRAWRKFCLLHDNCGEGFIRARRVYDYLRGKLRARETPVVEVRLGGGKPVCDKVVRAAHGFVSCVVRLPGLRIRVNGGGWITAAETGIYTAENCTVAVLPVDFLKV